MWQRVQRKPNEGDALEHVQSKYLVSSALATAPVHPSTPRRIHRTLLRESSQDDLRQHDTAA